MRAALNRGAEPRRPGEGALNGQQADGLAAAQLLNTTQDGDAYGCLL